jgi:F-type H+-transporting ATPase subunit delta
MSSYKLSLRYAKSLLDFAIEKNSLEPVYNDVKLIDETIHSNSELKAMMKSPVITNDKKVAVLSALFKDKINNITWSYIELVVKKNREAFLIDFGKCFDELYNQLKNISRVKITTATQLSESVQAQIKNSIPTKNTLEIENVIDAEILGGFKLQFENNMYDASMSKKLKDLKAQFLDESYVDKV